jgi:hypothetical protein
MAEPEQIRGASVTSRALSVLGAFEGSSGSLTVARIAARAQLPLSTTYRMVHELEQWGGLRKGSDGKYQVPEPCFARDVLERFSRGTPTDKSPKLFALVAREGKIRNEARGQFPPTHSEHVCGKEEGIHLGRRYAHGHEFLGRGRNRASQRFVICHDVFERNRPALRGRRTVTFPYYAYCCSTPSKGGLSWLEFTPTSLPSPEILRW